MKRNACSYLCTCLCTYLSRYVLLRIKGRSEKPEAIINRHHREAPRAFPVFWDLRTTPAPSSTTANNNVPSKSRKVQIGRQPHTEAGIHRHVGVANLPMDKEKGRRVKPHTGLTDFLLPATRNDDAICPFDRRHGKKSKIWGRDVRALDRDFPTIACFNVHWYCSVLYCTGIDHLLRQVIIAWLPS